MLQVLLAQRRRYPQEPRYVSNVTWLDTARNCVTRSGADGGAIQSRGAGQYNSLDKSRGNVKVRRCATESVSTDVGMRAEVKRAEASVDTVRASRCATTETAVREASACATGHHMVSR